MTRYPEPRFGFFIGQRVNTPDGVGVVVHVHHTYADRWQTRPSGVESVEVGFDSAGLRFEASRTYAPTDITPRRAEPKASVEEWIAARATPGFKPRDIRPRPRKLPRLPEARFRKLLAEQGGRQLS
ncbi:hypothetical protein [Microbacterium sp. XT11]|uniref:hypothetical protein n=1 Tax=Microbacterium sp. XT11 TaxID=367477 RepID=UPI0008340A51|nr:hypothetical protein [Microbacterium sp. XT11]